MRVAAVLALLVALAACDRSAVAPRAGVVPAPQAALAPTVNEANEIDKAADAARKSKLPGGSRPAASRSATAASRYQERGSSRRPDRLTAGNEASFAADEACAGLGGNELDDCLGVGYGDQLDGGSRFDHQAIVDFRAEQERRDRELMEQEAAEAAARDQGWQRDNGGMGQYDDPAPEQFPLADDPDFIEPPPDYGWR